MTNWGLRARHDFNAANGRLQEQNYSVYRDLRSWTGRADLPVIDNGNGPKDFTVAFTFSLKGRAENPRRRRHRPAVPPARE